MEVGSKVNYHKKYTSNYYPLFFFPYTSKYKHSLMKMIFPQMIVWNTCFGIIKNYRENNVFLLLLNLIF